MWYFVFNTEHTDGIAPLGSKASAGTVITMLISQFEVFIHILQGYFTCTGTILSQRWLSNIELHIHLIFLVSLSFCLLYTDLYHLILAQYDTTHIFLMFPGSCAVIIDV